MSFSVKSHLTSGASVRPENIVTYPAGNEGQKICGVFSETSPLQRSSTAPLKAYVHFPVESTHAHCIARVFSRFTHAWRQGFCTLVHMHLYAYNCSKLSAFVKSSWKSSASCIYTCCTCCTCTVHVYTSMNVPASQWTGQLPLPHTIHIHVCTCTCTCEACGDSLPPTVVCTVHTCIYLGDFSRSKYLSPKCTLLVFTYMYMNNHSKRC